MIPSCSTQFIKLSELLLKVEIIKIKSIRNFTLDIPIEQGLHAIAGTNGIGKSTIMALLAIPFRPALLNDLFKNSASDCSIKYEFEDNSDIWTQNSGRWKTQRGRQKVE